MHIDPIDDKQIRKLEQALTESPDTLIILGHANVGGGPDDFERLLAAHANLYSDFFAGYTAYGPKGWKLADYTPVIEAQPATQTQLAHLRELGKACRLRFPIAPRKYTATHGIIDHGLVIRLTYSEMI